MVVVTHEMDFAKRVADWVVVFDEGRMIEQGPPRPDLRAGHGGANARVPEPSGLASRSSRRAGPRHFTSAGEQPMSDLEIERVQV